MNDEIKCEQCGMEAEPRRLDTGVTEQGEVIFICPVCGNDLGEITAEVSMKLERKYMGHPSQRPYGLGPK